MIPLAESSQLLPAREQMAFTLGFHIILSCLGVAFPAMMLIANYIGLKKNDQVALTLAQRWSNDLRALAELRTGLRAQLPASALCDAQSLAREIEAAYFALAQHS